MMTFIYTFVVVFIAMIIIFGIGAVLKNESLEVGNNSEGELTAAMCTTRLLDAGDFKESTVMEDFVIEQDMVYTFDSLNLEMDMEEL